ncbi:hypothetical protein BSNK01_03680 [Bacillaceae bacterium]
MKIHIVQKGETLWNIAKKYNVPLETLQEVNPHIKNPEKILAGMKIKIPTKKVPLKGKKEAPKAAALLDSMQDGKADEQAESFISEESYAQDTSAQDPSLQSAGPYKGKETVPPSCEADGAEESMHMPPGPTHYPPYGFMPMYYHPPMQMAMVTQPFYGLPYPLSGMHMPYQHPQPPLPCPAPCPPPGFPYATMAPHSHMPMYLSPFYDDSSMWGGEDDSPFMD